MRLPVPVAALMDDLEELCGNGDPSLEWSEAELAGRLVESASDVSPDDEVGWLRCSVAWYLWWAGRRTSAAGGGEA